MDQLCDEVKNMQLNKADDINQLWLCAIELIQHPSHKLKNTEYHFTKALYANTEFDKINNLLMCHECKCKNCTKLIVTYSAKLNTQFCINHIKALQKHESNSNTLSNFYIKKCLDIMIKTVYMHSKI